MGDSTEKGHEGTQESGQGSAAELKTPEALRKLRQNFTAKNFSDVPLALMEDGMAGSIGTKELTANARLLETSFKPIDAAIRVKRINAQMAGKGRDVPADATDEFLGISQTKQLEGQG